MKELTVSYRNYKKKYESFPKKKDSYNAEEKTIVLVLNEYQEKAIEFETETGSDRDIREVVNTIEYHLKNSNKEDVEERLENAKEWYKECEEDDAEDDLREAKESIELLSYILKKGWHK